MLPCRDGRRMTAEQKTTEEATRPRNRICNRRSAAGRSIDSTKELSHHCMPRGLIDELKAAELTPGSLHT